MKILNYKIKDDTILVYTDNELYPLYEFSIKLFPTLQDIKDELNRKIAKKQMKQADLETKKDALVIELDTEINA